MADIKPYYHCFKLLTFYNRNEVKVCLIPLVLLHLTEVHNNVKLTPLTSHFFNLFDERGFNRLAWFKKAAMNFPHQYLLQQWIWTDLILLGDPSGNIWVQFVLPTPLCSLRCPFYYVSELSPTNYRTLIDITQRATSNWTWWSWKHIHSHFRICFKPNKVINHSTPLLNHGCRWKFYFSGAFWVDADYLLSPDCKIATECPHTLSNAN